MSKLIYRVDFQNKFGKTKSQEYEFNDENHFNNWHQKQLKDESYRKIIGFEKVNKKDNFDIHEIIQAFNIGRNTKLTFAEWYEKTFKQ